MHEIYDSVQGESTLAGVPCTFIRLAGCPLKCTYCDTPQAIPPRSGEEMALEEILDRVRAFDHPLVLVTGGEPLAQKNCIPLLEALKSVAPTVQLETAGALDISKVPDGISIIMDIKTPSSGEESRNRWQNLAQLKAGDELKFVIGDRDDYDWIKRVCEERRLAELNIPLLASPAWGSMDPARLVAWILEDRLPFRLQLQQHKYIWGAEATGV